MALFGLGKKTFTFGLDIGSSSIKAIELHEGKSGWVLSAFAQVALPRDVISEDTINEPGLVSDAVREDVQKPRIKGTNAAHSLSGRTLFLHPFPLPTPAP